MNFDLESLEPFLQRLAQKIEGFSPVEIAAVMRGVSEMAVDEERDWNFTVQHAGSPVPLRVHIFLDDVDAPDLAFFTSAELASLIQEELVLFAQEQGW
jgi:hypothetical protein